MPYSSVDELPPAVRQRIKSPRRRRQWMHVWNSEYSRHGDESRAFASAWATAQKGAKVDKAEAEYVDLAPGADHCAACTMFIPPDSCTAVRDSISPFGWCKFFEAKLAKEANVTTDFTLFIPLAKVDKAKRTISGYASTPAKDLDGEIVSLDAVKAALPGYMQWRNIREMHTQSAVGVAQEAGVDTKGLFLTAKIVDDAAWKKVEEEVYKGFSIGGKKLNKVGDTITEIELVEISVVDRPANPECRFAVNKRAKVGEAAHLVKIRLPPQDRAVMKMAQAVELLAKAGPAAGQGTTPRPIPAGRDGFSLPARPGRDSGESSEFPPHAEKRDVPEGERKDLAQQGKALPGGGFPIKDKSDLDNARSAFGRAKNKPATRRLIVRRAKELGVKLPDKWKKKAARVLIAKAETAAAEKEKMVEVHRAQKSAGFISVDPSFLTLTADAEDQGSHILNSAGGGKSGHELVVGGGESPAFLTLQKGRKKDRAKAKFAARGGTKVLPGFVSKRMSAAGQLVCCFDTLRCAQRELIREAKMEGGDRKDAALAKEVGAIAKRVAEIIGQKATHEGSEALDLSDADDFDMKYYMEDEMEKVVNNGADQDSDPIVAVLGELLAKAGREPSRVQRMQMARGNIRKARDETRDAEKCLKAAHAALRKAYFAKMAKAGKKDDDDDDDADEMAMKAIVAGFAKLSSVRTMLKAANGQLKKAASGRSGQRGQEVGDGEGRFYTVPPGVKDLSPNDLATAGPGSDARGSAPPIQSLEHEWKSAKADSRVKNAAARGYISTETAEALARAAAAEAKVEVLEKLPAVPSGGRRPALFDLSKLAPDAADQAGLMKGVDPTALTSTDENVRQKALGTVIGNMILGGQGKSVFSPDFRGGAGI